MLEGGGALGFGLVRNPIYHVQFYHVDLIMYPILDIVISRHSALSTCGF